MDEETFKIKLANLFGVIAMVCLTQTVINMYLVFDEPPQELDESSLQSSQ